MITFKGIRTANQHVKFIDFSNGNKKVSIPIPAKIADTIAVYLKELAPGDGSAIVHTGTEAEEDGTVHNIRD